MSEGTSKTWYKKWWGVIIAFLIWPYFLLWYLWAKSKFGTGAKIAITGAAFVALIIFIAVLPHPNTVTVTKTVVVTKTVTQPSNPAPKTAPAKTTTTTPSKAATPAPAPAGPAVLLDQSGSGQAQTAPFKTGKSWTVTYTFDCASFGGSGNFQFDVNNTDGSTNYDTGANDLAANGGSSDYFYDSGTHYLSINSECDWHITIKG